MPATVHGWATILPGVARAAVARERGHCGVNGKPLKAGSSSGKHAAPHRRTRTPGRRTQPVLLLPDSARRFRLAPCPRSEERRVGEEGRSRWAPDHLKKK